MKPILIIAGFAALIWLILRSQASQAAAYAAVPVVGSNFLPATPPPAAAPIAVGPVAVPVAPMASSGPSTEARSGRGHF